MSRVISGVKIFLLSAIFVVPGLSHGIDIAVADFHRQPSVQSIVTESDAMSLANEVRSFVKRQPQLVLIERDVMLRKMYLDIKYDQWNQKDSCVDMQRRDCDLTRAEALNVDYYVTGVVLRVGANVGVSVSLYSSADTRLASFVTLEARTIAEAIERMGAFSKTLLEPALSLPSGEGGGERNAMLGESSATASKGKMIASGVNDSALRPAGMVRIPAGCFTMGFKPGNYDFNGPSIAQLDEAPAHEVCVDEFYLDATEVTNAAFGVSPSASHYTDGTCNAFFHRMIFDVPIVDAQNRQAMRPVACIDWREAKDYCERIGKRLPTEAEWEYSANAGGVSRWYWGNDAALADMYAKGGNLLTRSPSFVGQRLPNQWGLYDMSGNVWEWVSDYYDFYSSENQSNPKGPGQGVARVIRGGGFRSSVFDSRPANRGFSHPKHRFLDVGFRCAADRAPAKR